MNNQQPQMNVNLAGQPAFFCPACGSEGFIPTIKLVYLDMFHSPTKKDALIPVPMGAVCGQCGKPAEVNNHWKQLLRDKQKAAKKGGDA